MKTRILKTIVLGGTLFLFSIGISYAQSKYMGNWEGFFMNDFKTIVEIYTDENGVLSGSIKMLSGENLIQNDPITGITTTENQLSFFIAAKETNFKGKFNNSYTKLTGTFIFPDKSEHSIELEKKENETESEKESINAFKDSESVKFSDKELITDLDFLVDNLKKYHPRLYAYSSENEFKKMVDLTKQKIEPGLNTIEFFTLIAPVVEMVNCSHTGIQLPSMIQNELKNSGNYLPLNLIFCGNKAYCIENLEQKSKITSGDEILRINDVSVKSIKEKLYTFFPSEGNNKTTKNFYLKNNFNAFFNLIDNSPTFKIEYRNKDGIHYELLDACCNSELGNTKKSGIEGHVFFTFDSNTSTCYLTVHSFQFPDINEYIMEMDNIFLQINENKIQHLVLDLRGNSGGHPIFAAQLFSYLTNKEFTYFKRNDDIKEFEPLYNQMSPNKLKFEGDIYVFIDGGCLSTTGHLISLIKYYTNATFIGEEPGSTFQCNDFSVKVTLPNTSIEVNIPRTSFETVIDESEKMIPFTVDYQVSSSIEDYLKGKDSYIKFVNDLIL